MGDMLMKKQRQFSVLKIKSSRIKDSKYNITSITPEDARKHKELIELGDNQILKLIRRVNNKEVDFDILDSLIEKRNSIKNLKSNANNANDIDKIQRKIDKLTFIPEYIAVKIENDKHYDRMYKKGFKINNKNYVRLSCSASQARVDTVIFVEENTYKKVFKILCNGIDFKQEIVPSKFNAYFGLYSTSIYEVTEPRVCVIKDYETEIYRPIDFITEFSDGDIVERKNDVAIGCNYWDGMGIISPRMSKQWAKDLEVSYIPSNFIIRNSWVKGMVCTFDFHKFAREIAKKDYITDIYGVTYNIDEIDIILTESQFKLNKFYKSWQEWLENTQKNKLCWGVSRVAPQFDNEYMLTNYQFIQTLDLNEEEIKELAQPTIEWINSILNNYDLYATLFMSGGFRNEETVKDMLGYTENPYTQAILYNPDMIKDKYIRKKIYNNIQNKIKKAMIGKILVRGNFQMMIADPYGLCEHAFGMNIKGLLKEGQHYSDFWNKRNVKKVDAMRSPLTHYSEHNILNLQNTEEMKEWYKYITTGIIFNTFGLDCVQHADSDFDGDIVATTDNPYFLKGVMNEFVPITYKKKTALKDKITNENLYIADKNSFHSTIGTITNYSTSMYALLPLFDKSSNEYKELQRRLKILRKEQGSAIDHAKGILTKPFPKEWINYNRINDDDTEEIKNKKEFNNRILAEKKPYFMYYLYNNSKKLYNKFKNETNIYSKINFGISIDELLKKENKTKEESEYYELYKKRNPLNESNCVMNILCRYIEKVNEEEFKLFKENDKDYLLDLMYNKNYPIKQNKLKKIETLYEEYIKDKRMDISENKGLAGESANDNDYSRYENVAQYYLNRALRICSNQQELANYAIELDYKINDKTNKDFTWKVCKEGLIQNIKENNGNKVIVPILDDKGEIEYLGHRYSRKEVLV